MTHLSLNDDVLSFPVLEQTVVLQSADDVITCQATFLAQLWRGRGEEEREDGRKDRRKEGSGLKLFWRSLSWIAVIIERRQSSCLHSFTHIRAGA